MADAALAQLMAALAAQIADPGVGAAAVFTDRDDANPVQPGERPAKVIRCPDVVLDEHMEMGDFVQLHIASFEIDHYEDVDTEDDLNTKLSNAIAATVAAIGTDPMIGGRVFELTFVAASAAADNVPDAGVAVLAFTAKFLTQRYDWTQFIPFN